MEPFDCELLQDGWPAQPVNSISAVAFVLVGIWLWRRGSRVSAIATGLAGGTSVWFHGAPGGAASWGHDVALYALIAVGAIEVWRQFGAGRPPVLAGAILVAGLTIWFTTRTGSPLCDPDSVVQGHAMWHVMAAIAAGTLFARPDMESTART